MLGEEPANNMIVGYFGSCHSATVNDDADDISAFIDLSVLIRDFLW